MIIEKRIKPYTFDEVNVKKPKPKVSYSVRIEGYHSALGGEFDTIIDARICRIKLVKQARQSKDEWFKGKVRPQLTPPMHKIKNEWIRQSELYISKKTIHYYWEVNRSSYAKAFYEPIKTVAKINYDRVKYCSYCGKEVDSKTHKIKCKTNTIHRK